MSGSVLLILSGQDYTTMEFVDFASSHAEWSTLLAEKRVSRVDVADADHTFSSSGFRAIVEDATIEWLSGLDSHVVRSDNASDRLN